MTEIEAAKLVAVVAACFPGKLTLDAVAAYERMLLDLDYAAANAAVERLISTSTWPPTIAAIRDAALTVVDGEVRTGGEAWGDFLRAVGRWGRYRTPGRDFEFNDPLVADVVRALDWRELCDSENRSADRARFVDLYDELAAKRRREQVSETLPAAKRLRALQQGTRIKALKGGDGT